MPKLTRNNRRKLRKKTKANQSAENFFLSFFTRLIGKTLSAKFKKFKDVLNNLTYEDYSDIIDSVDTNKLIKPWQQLGNSILKSNRSGFEATLDALVQGAAYSDKRAKELKSGLNKVIEEKRIYAPLLEKFNENIQLIRDIPDDVKTELRNAYIRGEGLRGTDAEEFIKKRMNNRAKLIVRTESSKINAALTEVRAKSLNIKCYTWSTSNDQRVRPSHKMMDGVLVFWNDKPVLDKMTGHAGEYPNCRCVGIPIFELDDISFPVKVAHSVEIDSKYVKGKGYEKAEIVRGEIKSYTKQEFVKQYGYLF